MFRPSPKFLEKLEAKSKCASTLPSDERAFLDAAQKGEIERVRELLTSGVPVDIREDFCLHYLQNEQTALMYAAAEGHLEIVRLLLRAGASVFAVDKNMAREDDGARTPLHYAARQKNIAILEELLDAGADINALTTWRHTPLNTAILHNNIDCARWLVKRGVNLSSKIGRKMTYSSLVAAMDAVEKDVPPETLNDFVLQLLKAGADPNGTGDANRTAVFALASNEKLPAEMSAALLEKLLKAGAKPDWLDKFGSTPLEAALIRQNAGAVRVLLESGADVNRVFQRGTARDINEKDAARFERDLRELTACSPPAGEKAASRQKQLRMTLEDKLRRCNEIMETLNKFGAKRKSELPQLASRNVQD